MRLVCFLLCIFTFLKSHCKTRDMQFWKIALLYISFILCIFLHSFLNIRTRENSLVICCS